ncbi:hypothetical protein GCM10010869_21500 [Mesorhizobium tianshanense]|nr:hypothetical protein GCM10010869_21500 [Mesorhizobium tianshanense]
MLSLEIETKHKHDAIVRYICYATNGNSGREPRSAEKLQRQYGYASPPSHSKGRHARRDGQEKKADYQRFHEATPPRLDRGRDKTHEREGYECLPNKIEPRVVISRCGANIA